MVVGFGALDACGVVEVLGGWWLVSVCGCTCGCSIAPVVLLSRGGGVVVLCPIGHNKLRLCLEFRRPRHARTPGAGSRDIRKTAAVSYHVIVRPQRHKRGVIATAVSCYVIIRPDEQSAHVPRGGQHITKVS